MTDSSGFPDFPETIRPPSAPSGEAGAVRTQSFLSIYCDREKIAPAEFIRALFDRCLMRRKRLMARIARKLQPRFFYEDELLIQTVGEKHSMAEVRKEISEYFADRHYWGFWRGRMDIRISTERLRLTAEMYLRE